MAGRVLGVAIMGALSRPELPPKITGWGRAVSVLPLDVLQLDHALPARDLALDELAHFLGARGRRHAAEICQPLANIGNLENRTDLADQPVDERSPRRRPALEADAGVHFRVR